MTNGENSVTHLKIRELFAAMQMQGMNSNMSYTTHFSPKEKAELAVMNADALIIALNKTKET